MTLLTIGVASSALFDLTESDRVFREQGVAAYREHQEERLDQPLPAGPALPFIRRLLGLNDVLAEAVDVIVLSRNSAESGLRVMRSISSAGLPITRAAFREGRSAFEFMPALEMSLFLSANHDDVSEALAAGHPAGTVLRGSSMPEVSRELRVAFDFDGVLADDSSERVFRQEGMGRYALREAELADVPLSPGPLAPFLAGLNRIQEEETTLKSRDSGYEPRLRISLVTARSAPAHERAVNSLRAWGLKVDDAFFLGGLPKAPILEVLNPHLFFDDQRQHLDRALRTPSVHVPFGVANEADAGPAPVSGTPRRARRAAPEEVLDITA